MGEEWKMKIDVSVKVEYQFEIEVDDEQFNKMTRPQISELCQIEWEKMSSCGLEEKHYHDTEIEWEI